MSGLDLRALREAAEAATAFIEPPWPKREIDRADYSCDGCAETKHVIAAYDDPSGTNEPWLCAQCAIEVDWADAANPSVVLALLDRVEAAEGAVERVRALAEFWVEADGEPATDRDLTVLNVTNRHGRELTAALDPS